MVRRMTMAVVVVAAAAWFVMGEPAVAQYPPVPEQPNPTVQVSPRPPVVVVVRGAPSPPGRLVQTGTSSAIPLTVLATASVGLGVTLVCLGRSRRRSRRRLA